MIKYPRILTSDVKKFKFALKIDTVKKVAELSANRKDPNVSETLNDLIEEYFSNI